ncbi:hypothetical protein LCGC14_0263930 [marine sediment metagenome]|uniref:Uncharacterized protein n=1 Tax=marine sediment metagenome TaxID=412755 RepID=A0A0F9U5G6_9ZZZZ
MNEHKTDHDLLVEVHSTVARIDERTKGLPGRVTALEIGAAEQRRDVSMLRRMAAGIFTVFLGLAAFVVKIFVGDS